CGARFTRRAAKRKPRRATGEEGQIGRLGFPGPTCHTASFDRSPERPTQLTAMKEPGRDGKSRVRSGVRSQLSSFIMHLLSGKGKGCHAVIVWFVGRMPTFCRLQDHASAVAKPIWKEGHISSRESIYFTASMPPS